MNGCNITLLSDFFVAGLVDVTLHFSVPVLFSPSKFLVIHHIYPCLTLIYS